MIAIYQVLPRLYGNRNTTNQRGGSLEENGCGKMNDFTAARLQRIRDCGFTHIWYTGLLEHATQTSYEADGIAPDQADVVKGRAGSPYAVKDYYDVDPDLAVNVNRRMGEFENLVRRTHRAGLKMIMDFVPNHVARQYRSDVRPKGVRDLGQDDDTGRAFSPANNFYYLPGEELHLDHVTGGPARYAEVPAKATGNDRFDAWPGRGDWYETVKLNYGVDYVGGRVGHFEPVPSTWLKMTDILLFWAGKGIDGFRCDMAEMVPVEFWHYAIARVKRDFPHVIFIAEVYEPAQYRRYIHQGGFDFLYDKVGLYDTLRRVVRHEQWAADVTHCWQQLDDIRPHMLNFLENHDEQRIASDFYAGEAERALPALVVSALLGQPFMLYAGQELGERGMDEEGFSGRDGRTSIFDYWSVGSLRKLLVGERAFTAREKRLYDYHRTVVRLMNDAPALREGAFYDLEYANYCPENGFDASRHFAFLRSTPAQTVLVVANFADTPMRVGVNIPEHAFAHLHLAEGTRQAADLLTGQETRLELSSAKPVEVELPACGAVVLAFGGADASC